MFICPLNLCFSYIVNKSGLFTILKMNKMFPRMIYIWQSTGKSAWNQTQPRISPANLCRSI